MKIRREIFALLTLTTGVLACALPGTSTGSPIPPTPDNRLENMVAQTVSAAIEMTANAVPEATSTPTEIPPTPTLQALSEVPGSTLTVDPDGTTLFVDGNAGYQVRFPAGWLAVRVNEQEYYDAWTLPEAADPQIQSVLQAIQKLDPVVFRVSVLDIQENHISNEIVTNINLAWEQGEKISFETDADLQTIADSMSTLQSTTILSVETATLPNGEPFGLIKTEAQLEQTIGFGF